MLALRELRVVVLEPALLLVLIVTLFRRRSDPARLTWALVAAGIGAGAAALALGAAGQRLIEAEGVVRLAGLSGSPNHLALFLGRLLPLAIALVLLHTGSGQVDTPGQRHRTSRLLPTWQSGMALLGTGIIGAALLFSFSRGAWLASAAGVAVVLIGLLALRGGVAPRTWRRSVARWRGGAAGRRTLIAVVAALVLVLVLGIGLATRVERLSSIGDPLGGTMALRLQLWGAALRMALDHPLFGVGPDGFLYAYPAYREGVAWKEPFVSHPHNLILDYWLRGGIMGIAALGWLLAAWGRGVWAGAAKGRCHGTQCSAGRSAPFAVACAGAGRQPHRLCGTRTSGQLLLPTGPRLRLLGWCGRVDRTHATHTRLANRHAGEECLAMRVLVVGGAGMIGSHVCEMLLADDHEVWCLDNLLTGFGASVAGLTDRPGFTLVNADVSEALPADLPAMDWILHLASPASPLDFRHLSLEIMAVNARGTEHLLAFARQHGSRFLFASTSEVYGDPQEHPQRETYWGHVNPIGLRGCYDESKRYGEALTMAYSRRYDLDVRIVRIFNTYGPRTRHYDGRVVPTFICNAIADEPLVP